VRVVVLDKLVRNAVGRKLRALVSFHEKAAGILEDLWLYEHYFRDL
jgi:hypothetical protein